MKPLENAPDGESMKVSKQPVFQAQKRQADGKIAVGDIVLQVATTLVFEDLVSDSSGGVKLTFKMSFPKGNKAAFLTTVAVSRAIQNKHLASINNKGNRNDARIVARELIIDTLANKKDWGPYAKIFAAFAERNDRDFFERVVRGIQRRRKPVFSPAEWTAILNWHEWNSPYTEAMPENIPPLKYWTDESALSLIQAAATNSGTELKLNLPGLRTMRVRLGLEQEKPARVKGFFPARESPGTFKIETVD